MTKRAGVVQAKRVPGTNVTYKIENYFIFELVKKKNLGQVTKNYRTFYPKNFHLGLKNIGVWDPGFGKDMIRNTACD